MPVLNTPRYGGNIASLLPAPLPTTPQPVPVPFNTYDLNNPMSLMSVSPTFQQPGVTVADPNLAPGFMPEIDQEGLATGVDAEKKRLKGDRNKKLGFMLYALGGALRGDKNFVQNTMQIRTLQEGKEKEDKKKKAFQDYINKLPDGSYKDLAKAMGYENLDKLLLESYKTQNKKLTVGDYKAYLAEKKLKGIPFTAQDEALENYLTKTDPIDQLTNAVVQQQLAALGIGGTVGSTPDPSGLAEFPSLEAAKKAGLKSGDQFRGTDGNVYRLP